MRTTVLVWAGLLVGMSVLSGQELQVYRPGNGVPMPTVVREARPYYPVEAKAPNIRGTVLMTAVVREDDTVGDTNITRSLDTKYGLDAEAVKAAKQWTFNPGTKGGKPVPVRVNVEIAFGSR